MHKPSSIVHRGSADPTSVEAKLKDDRRAADAIRHKLVKLRADTDEAIGSARGEKIDGAINWAI